MDRANGMSDAELGRERITHVKVTPKLMSREARRKLLFAPIGVHYYGAKSWGGHTTIDEGDNPRKESSPTEYVAKFRRKSNVDMWDEGDE